eukprot:2269499-Rhodomonas_salina.1
MVVAGGVSLSLPLLFWPWSRRSRGPPPYQLCGLGLRCWLSPPVLYHWLSVPVGFGPCLRWSYPSPISPEGWASVVGCPSQPLLAGALLSQAH